ncbi:MAG: hypothetical protein ING33_03230 [Rhodocyclaceae bacterium]|nr:hypothetical protein [Rhodocyclaceae bacterium]
MPIFLTPTLLEDLKTSQDARFIKRVLDHLCDENGDFPAGRDDHRYDGIPDAWIRYVSAGRTAFRMIYVREGPNVYIYRAGVHSVEDRLPPPAALSGIEIASPAAIQAALAPASQGSPPIVVQGHLVKTSQRVMLSRLISSMLHVPHHEILLVSPYYSEVTLSRHSPLGRFLDKAIEENTLISLVTREPGLSEMEFFQSLEERGIVVYFHPKLHAKLYVFDIDEANCNQYHRDVKKTAVLGSANLTEMGLALSGKGGNEELCYQLPSTQFREAQEHAYWLITQSTDFVTYRHRITRRF